MRDFSPGLTFSIITLHSLKLIPDTQSCTYVVEIAPGILQYNDIPLKGVCAELLDVTIPRLV